MQSLNFGGGSMNLNGLWVSVAFCAVSVSLAQARLGPSFDTAYQFQVVTPGDQAAAALKLFDEQSKTFPPSMQSQVPWLRKLINSYLMDEVMTQSQVDVAVSTLEKIGFTGMKGSSRNVDWNSLFGGNATSAPSTVKSSHATDVTTIRSKPSYKSGSNRIPGHATLAWVKLSIEGRSRTIIEVPASNHLTSVARAQAIAKNLEQVSRADRLWWMKISAGQYGGEEVVNAPGAPLGFIVTADVPFAKLFGETTDQLARSLITRIQTTMDNRPASLSGKRDFVPDPRSDAVDLRDEGDDIFATDPKAAEAKYRAAISTDPSYAVAYTRLVDLLVGQKRYAEADRVRTDGCASVASDADRSVIKAAGRSAP